MNLIAIDTAREACSVAVVGDAVKPVTASEIVGRGHAERLFGMAAEVMAEAGLDFAGLGRIAVTVGPGSFTGIRGGIAAARGFGLALKRPVVGIGTLEAHAASARRLAGSVPVLALLDARRGEIFGQHFSADGKPLGVPAVASPETFAGQIGDGEVLAGAGADLVLAARDRGGDTTVVHRLSAPDILAVAEIAAAAEAPAAPPRPLYLRPPDAKPQPSAGVARQ
jgi:tRNA threonylcarbamoyladenosine biosynthesis protein TsaB